MDSEDQELNPDDFYTDTKQQIRANIFLEEIERLNSARQKLNKLQHQTIYQRIYGAMPPKSRESINPRVLPNVLVGAPKKPLPSSSLHVGTTSSSSMDLDTAALELLAEEQLGEEEASLYMEVQQPPQQERAWLGYFKGYTVLNECNECDDFCLNEPKKCVELTKFECQDALTGYIRSGINCYFLDLFTGTQHENQSLIVLLRECQLRVAQELGFPVTVTLFAQLSPRLQYTGELCPHLLKQQHKTKDKSMFALVKGAEFVLSANREHSWHCSKQLIYVNARFLMEDLQLCDFICIGSDIQVQVIELQLQNYSVRCRVVIGGQLQSRMPVLFPERCNKERISGEELEDIVFAHEVGINVIVSYVLGSEEYLKELTNALKMLELEKMRLGARVVLNELRGCEADFRWAAEGYDCFIIELRGPPPGAEAEIMELCPAAADFMDRAYELMKPLILDAAVLNTQRLLIASEHQRYIFYCPDKYLFRCNSMPRSFYTFLLQESLFKRLPAQLLSPLLYCDVSHCGSNALARAAVSTAYEREARIIFVLGITGRMAIKLSHYRPKAPIIFVTAQRSTENYICLYNNVIIMYTQQLTCKSIAQRIYTRLMFGVLFAMTRHMLRHGDNMVFVYNSEGKTLLPDKYVCYKMKKPTYKQDLKALISKNPADFEDCLTETLSKDSTVELCEQESEEQCEEMQVEPEEEEQEPPGLQCDWKSLLEFQRQSRGKKRCDYEDKDKVLATFDAEKQNF